jgi:hypothetical protein
MNINLVYVNMFALQFVTNCYLFAGATAPTLSPSIGGSSPEVTWGAVMIIVCDMLSCNTNNERNNHDPQTIHKKIIENLAKYVDFKSYV